VENFCCWSCERCKHLKNANGYENRQRYYSGGLITRDVEAAILTTVSASTPIASASTNKKRENDR